MPGKSKLVETLGDHHFALHEYSTRIENPFSISVCWQFPRRVRPTRAQMRCLCKRFMEGRMEDRIMEHRIMEHRTMRTHTVRRRDSSREGRGQTRMTNRLLIGAPDSVA